MRLTREQVDKISGLILNGLKEKDLIVFKTGEDTVLARIRDAILADLQAEDALDREVEEILKAHSGGAGSGQIDLRKMFSMVKGKLARERGIVI